MFPTSAGGYSFTVALADEAATYRLMTDVAALIEPGDLITLSGDLGAGKTTFARALIRYFAADESIEVPSPTFTLTQTYTLPRFPLVHVDLYRLSGAAELTELGFDDASEDAVTLLEWPDRAAGFLPADRLDIAFALAPQQGPNARHARISGYGTFTPRAERILAIRQFLDRSSFRQATRHRIQGDASTRSYERLTRDGATYILMNSPKRPDGPPVREGKPYSAIAHLAESVTPFVAMAHGLREHGFSAPAIFAADRKAGLLVIEDLGDELVVEGDRPAPMEKRYEAAVDLLAELHSETLQDVLAVEPGADYRLPRYDMDAFQVEVELLLDWYLPKLEAKITDTKRGAYRSLWRDALLPVTDGAQTWVLRDFHSPNLLWLPEREGTARIGLLDFQDAVMGPAAYDVASLSARCTRRRSGDNGDRASVAIYPRAVVGQFRLRRADIRTLICDACRAARLENLGIFTRLERRDHKPQYLRHLPRVWAYLQRSLAHPALAPLAAWYRANVPPLKV